jgi:hypothetical protein
LENKFEDSPLDRLAKEAMQRDPSLQFHEALKLVARESRVTRSSSSVGMTDSWTDAELAAVERQIEDLVKQKQELNPRLKYHEALKLVASEHRDLDVRKTRLSRRRMNGDNE